MGATLRVDPNRLVTASSEQAAVGEFVSGLAPGRPMSGAASGMPNLDSGAACQLAAAALDDAAVVVSDELTAYSSALSAAADHYRNADAELGRRLAAHSE